jgi:ferric-dicitrate binding protein FerR (iron transport regulator)
LQFVSINAQRYPAVEYGLVGFRSFKKKNRNADFFFKRLWGYGAVWESQITEDANKWCKPKKRKQMEQHPDIWDLIGKQLNGEASSQEVSFINTWLQESPSNREAYEKLQAIWKDRPQPLLVSSEAVNKAWQRVSAKTVASTYNTVQGRFLYKPWAAVAAVVMLVLVAWWFLVPSERTWEQAALLTLATQPGEKQQITLPDGSVVWLNENSSLTYPETFSALLREVALVGEAYFEVQASPEKPFLINLRKGQVRVIGTKFNVRSIDEEPVIETSVITGRVEFLTEEASSQKSPLLLTPNNRAAYDTRTGEIQVVAAESVLDASWKDGQIVFRDAPLHDVARILQRKFRKTVQLSNKQLANCRFTATFTDEPLEELLDIMALTGEYRFRMENDTVTIEGKGCP